jgi:hypothetical protein
LRKKTKLLAVLSVGLMILGGLSGCATPVSKVTSATITRSLERHTGKPLDPSDTFTTNVPKIYCAFKLSAPAGTKVRARWAVLKGECLTPQRLVNVEMTLPGRMNTRWFYFFITRPKEGWSAGSYQVTVDLDEKEAVTLPFIVVAP